MACQYADRVAAVAPVAGMRDVPRCAPSRPVPAIAFHGTDDQLLRYDGGLGPKTSAMQDPDGSGRRFVDDPAAVSAIVPGPVDESVPDILAAWAARNGCAPGAHESAASPDTTLLSFTCPLGAEVELYRTQGAGHEWPGSAGSAAIVDAIGRTTMTIDATTLAWAFFQQHSLPAS
jgi:polyhydroxybutyrate depolymerase